MANEEALGPRKTMFVLVIVVGCFAVLWPRILSPLILGSSREQLKPNQFDRDTGCCEVLFESEVAVLELLNEVCASALQADGKLTPLSAAECRKAVNETCGLDIAAFLKRSNNVGKTTKMLLDTMKTSNSSCLKEHFGVPVWSVSTHLAVNSWMQPDTLKQERPLIRGIGPHPALRERGRAIPPAAGVPPPPRPEPLPAHVRVRTSPLQGYFELDIKPPPIPGMRPPLGSPGGPVQAPKSSMGFVMPIYTICIIVFFVYTLSKILFKRTGTVPYDEVTPDPQFRRRVFRDDSRSSPDKLVVTAISGLVAEVQQQMEAGYANNQQRQDVQDNHARPYTNGTVIHSGPVQIVASEYREPSKDRSPEPKEKEPSPEPKEPTPEPKDPSPEPKDPSPEPKESSPEPKESSPEPKESNPEPKESSPEPKVPTPESRELSVEPREPTPEPKDSTPESSPGEEEDFSEPEESPEQDAKEKDATDELIKLTDNLVPQQNSVAKLAADFLEEEKEKLRILSTPELENRSTEEKQSTPELLEEALKEDSPSKDEEKETENGSVKVVGMEVTAHAADGSAWPREEGPPLTPMPPQRQPHEAEQVKSIYLEAEIPQQSRVLVADFADRADARPATKHSPLVVSGKMTLSLIQDAPRDTPERDPDSTMDEFTTASAVTQPAADKDNLSDEEMEEEIEIEEIEEEVEEEEEEDEEEEEEPKKIEAKKEEKKEVKN